MSSKLYETTACIPKSFFLSSQRNKLVDEKSTLNQSKDPNGLSNTITLESVVDGHEGLLWFWALWECAQFCSFQSKLKTPLGKALDTFVAIESIKY